MVSDVLEREWRLLGMADTAARAALAAPDPATAYEAICWSRNHLLDDPGLPHAGAVFCAWAELEDLYEIGGSSPDQFQSVVRDAAQRWLERPAAQSSDWLERWVIDTRGAVAARFGADGTILGGKHS